MNRSILMPTTTARRGLMWFVAAMAAALLYLTATSRSAEATSFCHVYLQPYGQNGDRCYGPPVNTMDMALIVTFSRAGCVSVANGNFQLMQSWVCGPAGSAPAFAAGVAVPHDGIWRYPVIRNNNLSFGANFQGQDFCYAGNPPC